MAVPRAPKVITTPFVTVRHVKMVSTKQLPAPHRAQNVARADLRPLVATTPIVNTAVPGNISPIQAQRIVLYARRAGSKVTLGSVNVASAPQADTG